MAITDLTGTTWQLNDTIPPTSPSVSFVLEATITSDGYSITLPYTVGKYNYTYLTLNNGINTSYFAFGAAYSDGSTIDGYFIKYWAAGGWFGAFTEAGWRYNTYNYSPSVPLKTAPIISAPLLHITGGADATNTTLIAWLEANAKLVEAETSPTTITYNGTEIASLEEGQTATLSCAGKKMAGNVVVSFGGAGGITYNGSTTELEAGKTATLQCSGKKMATDVVVEV